MLIPLNQIFLIFIHPKYPLINSPLKYNYIKYYAQEFQFNKVHRFLLIKNFYFRAYIRNNYQKAFKMFQIHHFLLFLIGILNHVYKKILHRFYHLHQNLFQLLR